MSGKTNICKKASCLLALLFLLLVSSINLLAEESNDNSLSSLGITSPGAVVSPDFYYSTVEYYVYVPAGTTQLQLDPVTTDANAQVMDISGTDLSDGSNTTVITVSAPDGTICQYFLYVSIDESLEMPAGVQSETAAETEKETEAQTEKVTEKETEKVTEKAPEDDRYVMVEKTSLEDAENTITSLKEEISSYRDNLNFIRMVLYITLALCVVLIFLIVNLLLKKRELRLELKQYQLYGYAQPEEEYYDPQQNAPAFSQEPIYQSGKPAEAKPDPQTWEQPAERNGEPQVYFPQHPETVKEKAKDEQPRKKSKGKAKPLPQEPQPLAEDSPEDIPRPTSARRVEKPQPKYEAPQPAPSYQASSKEKKGIEITMIDI